MVELALNFPVNRLHDGLSSENLVPNIVKRLIFSLMLSQDGLYHLQPSLHIFSLLLQASEYPRILTLPGGKRVEKILHSLSHK